MTATCSTCKELTGQTTLIEIDFAEGQYLCQPCGHFYYAEQDNAL